MNTLYPLKFIPQFKEKLWGGQKLKNMLEMSDNTLLNCGEAWVISGYKDQVSLVKNGFLAGNNLNDLISIYMGDIVGDEVYEQFGDEFPLLIKFIDAKDWLSIQVHPNDDLAAERNIGRGKTEMWYVLQAEENAQLISGFNKKITPETYQKLLREKKLPEVLNYEKVVAGDVFLIPAGRIHAIGPGVLLAEIQQSSDTTYRLYDWDRIDAAGMPRELHTEKGLDAIDFDVYPEYKTRYKSKLNQTISLVESLQFTTNLLTFDDVINKNFEELDSFVIYMGIEGNSTLSWHDDSTTLKTGEAILIPNVLEKITLQPHPKATILEVYLSGLY